MADNTHAELLGLYNEAYPDQPLRSITPGGDLAVALALASGQTLSPESIALIEGGEQTGEN